MAQAKQEPIPETAVLYDVEIERYLKDAVDICPEALEEEFTRLPADLAYWNERHAVALREHLDTKIERERLVGQLSIDVSFVDALETSLGKKPTVNQIQGAVLQDPRYIAVRTDETLAEVEKIRLRGCVDAIAAKRDMIISLGAHARLEMQHDPILRARMAGLREVDTE